MRGRPKGRAQVGGAECEEPEAVVVGEGEGLLNFAHGMDEAAVDGAEVAAL